MHASEHVSMLLVLWETSPSFYSDDHANTLSTFTVSCGLAGDIGRATIVYVFQFKRPGHARLRTPQQDKKIGCPAASNWTPSAGSRTHSTLPKRELTSLGKRSEQRSKVVEPTGGMTGRVDCRGKTKNLATAHRSGDRGTSEAEVTSRVTDSIYEETQAWHKSLSAIISQSPGRCNGVDKFHPRAASAKKQVRDRGMEFIFAEVTDPILKKGSPRGSVRRRRGG